MGYGLDKYTPDFQPYFLIIITFVIVMVILVRPEGVHRKILIKMYLENRVGAAIRITLFLSSLAVVILSRNSLLNEELPIIELLFSAFTSAALVAFFTPDFKRNLTKYDLIGLWEYTSKPSVPAALESEHEWGQHPGKRDFQQSISKMIIL